MDKHHTNPSSSEGPTDSNPNPNPNNRDQFLHHLSKLSHKISKPTSSNPNPGSFKKPNPPLPQTEPPVQQQQPPVYNINKSDFRDVVQKLTGSPAHAPSPSPPIHAPKPASSRLQRIRPPPLAQLTTRPAAPTSFSGASLSPLPPLPSCHAAAESPISAYMRFLHSSSGMMFPPPESLPEGGELGSFPPLPFGCLPSPKSPCPLLSPKMMMPPPVSPTVSGVPSPKWRD